MRNETQLRPGDYTSEGPARSASAQCPLPGRRGAPLRALLTRPCPENRPQGTVRRSFPSSAGSRSVGRAVRRLYQQAGFPHVGDVRRLSQQGYVDAWVVHQSDHVGVVTGFEPP